MYYIYELSLFGRTFYIGISKNPVKRYKTHYHDPNSSCYKLIRYWLNDGKPMQMKIVFTANDKLSATKIETNLISKIGASQPLLNYEFSPHIFTSAIPNIEKLEISKVIKEEILKVKMQINES